MPGPVPANRLHDLALQLRAWEQRPDGYNYRVIDDEFVERMRLRQPRRADYDTIKIAQSGTADPKGFGTYLEPLRLELAKELKIKEPIFPWLSSTLESIRAALG